MKYVLLIGALLLPSALLAQKAPNGDDYMRPDIRQRRLERQEQRWHDEQKWMWEQQQREEWLNNIQKH
jgi:hypothetical protein